MEAETAASWEREVEREHQLIREAAAWKEAQAIRDYVLRLEVAAATDSASIGPELQGWLAWAASVAVRLDPTFRRLRTQSEALPLTASKTLAAQTQQVPDSSVD